MNKEERINKLKELLLNSKEAISGTSLATEINVSRQVIVQYISLLKVEGFNIISTNKGYLLENSNLFEHVFKVKHTNEEIKEELYLFVDNGAVVKDVFVKHDSYGTISAKLNLASRLDVDKFCENFKSEPLKGMTNDIHYHTVVVKDESLIPVILEKLKEKHFHVE